ncbi:hypothetical protein [Halosegnis longus]|uniref:hypothetical protein n=1 Tax=Halosegnis longus TaxID=2216012 RepID=UPI00129DE164|nr:hypothetical protein [Halosegnis longus]
MTDVPDVVTDVIILADKAWNHYEGPFRYDVDGWNAEVTIDPYEVQNPQRTMKQLCNHASGKYALVMNAGEPCWYGEIIAGTQFEGEGDDISLAIKHIAQT